MRKIFEHYEIFPPDASEMNEYTKHLINGAVISIEARQATLAQTLLQKIDSILPDIKFNTLPLKISLVILKVSWHTTFGSISDAIALIMQEKTWFYKLQDHARSIGLAVTFANPLIHAKKYLEAINFLGHAIHHAHETGFLEKNAARLMLVLCYYELEEFSLVESLTRSLLKKYQASPADFKGELLLLSFFKKLCTVLLSDHKKHFQQLQQDLLALKGTSPESIMQLCDEFDYFLWIEGRL